MKDNITTFLYALILGAVCATLLGLVGGYTAPYKAANAKAEETRNILTVLDVKYDENAAAGELIKIFDEKITVRAESGKDIYFLRDGREPGAFKALAVPFAGPGLWGPIKGFLSLEPDRVKIRGIAFHEQEETPGLGGEIVADWFRNQFKGKFITDKSGRPGIIFKSVGVALGRNEVQGITGATMTCDKVKDMLDKIISEIVKRD